MLDASRSWCADGKIASYQWTFGDGSTAEGASVERMYEKPGSYSEILKVTDSGGNVAYDFAMVQVLDRTESAKLPPTIHAAYSPTFGIKVGDPVTFKVRTFRADKGDETWNFGDGGEPVKVHSAGSVKEHDAAGYAPTTHRFSKAGYHIVSVEGIGADGSKAIGRLAVLVGEKNQ
jgi:PKD repeat protein